MRTLQAAEISAAVRKLAMSASWDLEPDILDRLLAARDSEKSPLAKNALEMLVHRDAARPVQILPRAYRPHAHLPDRRSSRRTRRRAPCATARGTANARFASHGNSNGFCGPGHFGLAPIQDVSRGTRQPPRGDILSGLEGGP